MEENAMPVCEKLSEKQLFYTFQCYRLSKEPDLKDRVVRHFMPVAEREARRALRSAPQDMDRQDLVSYAILGMIEALEHYDPDRNPNMEGYVAAWIKGSLHKGIRTFLGKGRIRSILAPSQCSFGVIVANFPFSKRLKNKVLTASSWVLGKAILLAFNEWATSLRALFRSLEYRLRESFFLSFCRLSNVG